MSEDNQEFKIISITRKKTGPGHADIEPAVSPEDQQEAPYDGPEQRSGRERRITWDRRYRVRFEPNKDNKNRRSGKDRRKENQKPEGHWDLIPD
jgi:hypothetical protein